MLRSKDVYILRLCIRECMLAGMHNDNGVDSGGARARALNN